MKLKLDPQTALLTLIAVTCIAAATVAKRAFFSTTTIDSAAFTTLSTNLLAQSTASAARGVLNVTNATGLEASAADLATVSNSAYATVIALAGYSNSLPAGTNIVTLDGTQLITGAKTSTNTGSIWGGDGSRLTGVHGVVPIYTLDAPITLTNITTNVSTTLATNVFNLPGLSRTNSKLTISYALSKWDTVPLTVTGYFYIGQNVADATRLAFNPNLVTGSNLRAQAEQSFFLVLAGSYTNAWLGNTVVANTVAQGQPGTYVDGVDFSQPFVVLLKLVDQTTSAQTNSITFAEVIFKQTQ